MGLGELYILSKFRGVVTNVKDRALVRRLDCKMVYVWLQHLLRCILDFVSPCLCGDSFRVFRGQSSSFGCGSAAL
jgi:hypothetical protein